MLRKLPGTQLPDCGQSGASSTADEPRTVPAQTAWPLTRSSTNVARRNERDICRHVVSRVMVALSRDFSAKSTHATRRRPRPRPPVFISADRQGKAGEHLALAVAF